MISSLGQSPQSWTSGRVAPIEIKVANESPAHPGQRTGVNKAVKGTNSDGDQIVFKHNAEKGGQISKLLPKNYSRTLDVREVVASHIFADEFKLPSVTYQEGYHFDPQGQRQDGIVCGFLPGMSTLAKEGVESIKNPDQAVQENILKGWMGDWDIVTNGSNIFIDGNGCAIGGDYGNSLQKGISDVGYPRANIEIMRNYANPGNVDPLVQNIRSLSNDDIKNMVDRVGHKWIHDWDFDQSQSISQVLVHNRDLLREKNPFDDYYNGFKPLVQNPENPVVKALRPPLMGWPHFKWKATVLAQSAGQHLRDAIKS